MKKNVLVSKMKLHEFNNASLAKAIGISSSRLSLKINNNRGAMFTQDEIFKIRKLLKLSDAETIAIFFNDESEKDKKVACK